MSDKIVIDDLNNVETIEENMIINGKTKNLHQIESKQKEHLNINFINQKIFNEILKYIDVRSLTFYGCRVEDLSLLSKLEKVEQLTINWNSKATELWDMSNNKNLKILKLIDLSKLTTLEPISTLTTLEELDVSGGMWKAIKLNTLQPLSKLKQLKKLCLTNISIKDESLEPIAELKTLELLELSNQFRTEEYAKLSVRLRNTKCDLFSPYLRLSAEIDDKDIMITGKGKPFLSSKNDINKVKVYEMEFKKLQNLYSDVEC